MRRLVLALAVWTAVVAAPCTASGQDAGDTPDTDVLVEQLPRWTELLKDIDKQLKEVNQSLAVLGKLETTVKETRDQFGQARESLQDEVDRITALIKALGPAPKEGDPPEVETVAKQRGQLNGQLDGPAGQLASLDVMVQKANLLLKTISEAQVRVRKEQLLARTPSPFAPETWSIAVNEFVRFLKQLRAAPAKWYASPLVRAAVDTGYLAGFLSALLAAAALGWYLRRWLVKRLGRTPSVEAPSYRMRLLAALAEVVAHIAIPILIVAAAYGALVSHDLLFGVFHDLVLGFAVAVAAVAVMTGLPRAILSPGLPSWRLADVGDLAARLWYRRIFILAVVVGLDALISFPIEALYPSIMLRFTYDFVSDSAIAAVFLAMVVDRRLWLTSQEERRALAIQSGLPSGPPLDHAARRNHWWLIVRAVVAVLALTIPIAALVGYGVLSDFIARRLVATTSVFLIALVLHGLVRDLMVVFLRDEDKPPAAQETANPIFVWSQLLLDMGLGLAIVFLLVPIWGGHWQNIFDRVGWALSDLTIGGRTFSLTDVLMGMAVFVVLVVLVRIFQRFLERRVLLQTRLDVGLRDAIKTGIGYVGVVIAALVAINTAGFDLSGLAIIAGALSVGIGFGMQSIVNNFVSGLILLVERPIKVGDWIVVGQDEGYVKRISVRSTEIRTFSNASVIVPNSDLISGRVTNWMYKDRSGRIELPIGVAYGSDTAKVREVLLECVKGRDDIKSWPRPEVVFMDFGDSALEFQLRFFIWNVDDRLSIASDIRFAMDAAFREAGIAIPFPQRDVHIVDAGGQSAAAAAASGTTAAAPAGKVLPMRSGQGVTDAGLDGDGDG